MDALAVQDALAVPKAGAYDATVSWSDVHQSVDAAFVVMAIARRIMARATGELHGGGV